jgi:hypothetical protein
VTYAVIAYVLTVALWVGWALATASRERALRNE